MTKRARLPRRIRSFADVAAYQLCTGCGLCAFLLPERYRMLDVLDQGLRPVLRPDQTPGPDPSELLALCPGIHLEHGDPPPGADPDLLPAFGPVLELWEGHAADEEIRFLGSSGGAATALALFALEQEGASGVVHIGPRRDAPHLNEACISRTRAELLARTGSRYAPAAPCAILGRVLAQEGSFVFVGKPCDVAAVRAAAARDPQLERRIELTIAIFCAGTPSTRGTLELLEALGVEDPSRLKSLRYRGRGWPGRARAVFTDGRGEERTASLSYGASWGGILQRHRQWRCHLCLDHSGEFADIAVGDPWYRGIPDDEPGLSLVVVRSERGRRFLARALDAGRLELQRIPLDRLPASQPGFTPLRGQIWARLLALRLLGVPVPCFRRMPSFRFFWSRLSLWQKLKVFPGTWRRVLRRRLFRRRDLSPEPPAGP